MAVMTLLSSAPGLVGSPGPMVGFVAVTLLAPRQQALRRIEQSAASLCCDRSGQDRIPALRLAWARGGWNLAFLAGIVCGGWLSRAVSAGNGRPGHRREDKRAKPCKGGKCVTSNIHGAGRRLRMGTVCLSSIAASASILGGGFLVGFGSAWGRRLHLGPWHPRPRQLRPRVAGRHPGLLRRRPARHLVSTSGPAPLTP